uniref:Uncharacterized protein n=2 Tax=Aegilops tauschii subsp. strangulata TaxID=200361 RepID=A0A453Q4V0_AEGTS
CSVDAILRTPAGMEMPDVIDLRKSQMKEADNDQAERPLYQVLEQKEERTASAGALYRLNHAYECFPNQTPIMQSSLDSCLACQP